MVTPGLGGWVAVSEMAEFSLAFHPVVCHFSGYAEKIFKDCQFEETCRGHLHLAPLVIKNCVY